MTQRTLPQGPARSNVASVRVRAVRDGASHERPDRLAAEEPMEIRVGGPGQKPEAVVVTMRTPGSDFELAVGFLYTEGLVMGRAHIASVAYCELPADEQNFNVVTVRLAREFDRSALQRNFYATSSCGVCGKASLDQVRLRAAPISPGPVVAASVVKALPAAMRTGQQLFEQTGGLHAAGVFDAGGTLMVLREDVGRHNAVDKLVGWALLSDRLPLSGSLLMVSGRVSFEIVQKASAAALPIVCAVSAPSSLAVAAAEDLGMTVVGFVRGDSFNVYTYPERIDAAR